MVAATMDLVLSVAASDLVALCKYLELHGSSLFTVHATLGMAVGVGVTVAVDAAVGSGSLTLICQLLSPLVWPPFSIHFVH